MNGKLSAIQLKKWENMFSEHQLDYCLIRAYGIIDAEHYQFELEAQME